MTDKARVLFVDDEKRVLNSMRGMFRRDFDLFLTTEGAAAVKIASENPIDVIVADQRMPGMTGIEVLSRVKELSPNTIRILLTGYADPSAVEGSINVGEVFRFLGKPCPPDVLRETLDLAVSATRATAEASATRSVDPFEATYGSSKGDSDTRSPELPVLMPAYGNDRRARHDIRFGALDTEFRAGSEMRAQDIGVVVYTVDAGFAETAIRALAAERTTILATSLIKVMQAVERDLTGILITDTTTDGERLQKMIGALKQYLPELVTVVVSGARDTTDMVSLINHGQIFRYALKPVSPERLVADIRAAGVKHLELRNNPASGKRHVVDEFPIRSETARTLNRVLGTIRDHRSQRTGVTSRH